MALATLSVDLVAQLAKLEQGLNQAGRLAEKSAAQIERSFARANNIAGAIGVTLAGSLTGAGITAFVRATVDGIDKLNDLRDATGATIGNLSALEDIGARTGTGIDVVGDAVIRLNKVLAEATPGSATATQIKQLGLSAEELKRQDPAEALLKVAKAFQRYATDGDKARFASDLLGKKWSEIAPFINDLAEAGKLNATVTEAQAAQAEKLNKQLAAFQKNAVDAARAFASELVPALNDFFARSKALSGTFGSLTGGIGALFFEDRVTEAGAGVAQYTGELAKLQAQRDKLARGGSTFDVINLEKVDERIAKVQKLIEFYRTVFTQTAPDLGQSDVRELARRGRGPATLPSLPDAAGTPGKPKAAPRSIVDLDPATLDAARALAGTDVAKLQQLTAQLQALFELQRETRGSPAVAEAIAKTRAQIEALSATPVPDFALTFGVDGQFDAANAQLQQFLRSEKAAYDQTDEDVKKILGSLEKVDDRTKLFLDNVQDTFGDTLFKTLKGDFDNIGELWLDLLLRMAADAAAADFAAALGFGKPGGGGNLASLGTALVGLFGGGRAIGGQGRRGQLIEVNELGGAGELFSAGGRQYLMPNMDGVVTPTAQRGGYYAGAAGGAAEININVRNLQGQTTEMSQRRNASGGVDIEMEVKRIVSSDIDGNGQIYQSMKRAGVNRAGNLPRRG